MFAAPGEVLLTLNNPATGHTYHLLERTGWDDAEAKSIALGGHLVVVNDQAEQDFLWNTFGPLTGIFWIGFTDAAHEGRYVWTTGEPANYTNWFPGEPNNLYPSGERWANMWGDYNNGQWNDLGPDSDQGTMHFGVAEVRNGPDLFATLGDVPNALTPGQSLGLTGEVKNLGGVASAGERRLRYFLSSDRAFDAGDRALEGDVTIAADLAFNASVPVSANVAVPVDVTPGTYFVLAKVDADDTLAEADEANNVAVSAALDVGAVREPVFRTIRGNVRDADDLPLHGASVTAGAQTVFTDYDGKRSALDRDGVNGDFELLDALIGYNVTFGGTFGRFELADGDPAAQITASATDLAGTTFTRTVEVDEVLTLDPTQPDGGLPPRTPASLDPIFLRDYSTVAEDPAGTIRLHKDLRNDRNSDRITTRPNKHVAASARYRKGVEAVTTRLAALGFCETDDVPLMPVPEMKRNTPAERAVKLFKEVLTGAVTKAPGVVDEATLAMLNANPASAGELWTDTLPAKWSVAPDATDTYVSRATFEKLRALAEASPGVAEFVLTRASPAVGGGKAKTFRAGDEIEFRWIGATTTAPFWEPIEGFERKDVTLLGGRRVGVPDPSELGVRWRYVAGYDQAGTRGAIESLLNLGAVRVTFNDPVILQELGAITITTGTRSTIAVLRDDLVPAAGSDSVIHAIF